MKTSIHEQGKLNYMMRLLLPPMTEDKTNKNKRKDANYKQVIGYVHIDIVSEFRALCIKKGLNVSEGIEVAIKEWNEQNR